MKGEYRLGKLKGKQENVWLLIVKNDECAEEDDQLRQDKSVISNQKLEKLFS